MAVNARFWVRELTKFGNTDNVKVVLSPKSRTGENDNIDWSKFTPSGEITMSITSEGAQKWFEDRIGKDVAITFTDPE